MNIFRRSLNYLAVLISIFIALFISLSIFGDFIPLEIKILLENIDYKRIYSGFILFSFVGIILLMFGLILSYLNRGDLVGPLFQMPSERRKDGLYYLSNEIERISTRLNQIDVSNLDYFIDKSKDEVVSGSFDQLKKCFGRNMR